MVKRGQKINNGTERERRGYGVVTSATARTMLRDVGEHRLIFYTSVFENIPPLLLNLKITKLQIQGVYWI